MTSIKLASSSISESVNLDTDGHDELDRKYRAPALDKGLDILELLASRSMPMTTSRMASSLERSVSELFRMVITLEQRGYITETNYGYVLTNKLFVLGIAQYSSKTLLEVALPVLRDLAQEISQSCHMLVLSGDQVVVVARQESAMNLGFSMSVGHRSSIAENHAGAFFYGFSSTDVQKHLLHSMADKVDSETIKHFLAKTKKSVEQGYLVSINNCIDTVTDLCVPVFGLNNAIKAVISVPFLTFKSQAISQDLALELLQQGARKISQNLAD